ncbi:MAG: DUF262 domain-containing protein [Pseudomonadota bacterium]
MRFFPAEPDIATLFNRIINGDIDLQPDFQRGEVWPVTKQQRLIDSVLRGWVVPPVLLIAGESRHSQQVLDGQQRLASIRDFKLNKFPVDGRIEPNDDFISSLHGLRYDNLPADIKKAFDRTTVRIYEIADYQPEEPAEIFFRLNQPTALTPAEKRNAFFGPVRDQIRDLVEDFDASESARKMLGFSNSRMAYDDVFSRLACTLESNTLRKKITASSINEMYRRKEPISEAILSEVRRSLDSVKDVLDNSYCYWLGKQGQPKLNKATFFSWLLFFSRFDGAADRDEVKFFFRKFESSRSKLFLSNSQIHGDEEFFGSILESDFSQASIQLLMIYSDRATSRVSDVSSVLLRDFALWACWHEHAPGLLHTCRDSAFPEVAKYFSSFERRYSDFAEVRALEFAEQVGWGVRLQP